MKLLAVRLLDIFTDMNRKQIDKLMQGKTRKLDKANKLFKKAMPLIFEHVSERAGGYLCVDPDRACEIAFRRLGDGQHDGPLDLPLLQQGPRSG